MARPVNGYLLVLASAVLLGTLGMFSRLFYDEGGEPFTLLVLRFAGMGPALLAVVLLRRDRLPARRVVSAGLALGALQLGTAYSLFEGFARAPVGLVVLLFFVYPLIVSVGAAFLFAEELGARRLVLLVLGMAGVALTVGVPESASRVGIGLGLAAGICVACVVLSARYLMVSHEVSPVLLSALMFSSPSLVLVPLAAGRDIDLALSGAAWATAAGAIFVSGVIGISLFYTGVKLVGAGTASLLGIGEPFTAVLLGYAVLGESLSSFQLLGGALIVGAVTLLSVDGRRRPAAPS
jgi:drug/metabolite transporter (DMT)-like permease